MENIFRDVGLSNTSNFAAVSDWRSGVKSQNLKCCIVRFWNCGMLLQRRVYYWRFPTLPEACDHNQRKNPLMWPADVPSALFNFLAAISTVNVFVSTFADKCTCLLLTEPLN